MPKNIGYIIDNKKINVDVFSFSKGNFRRIYKNKYDVKIEDINFFQFCIDMIGYDKALLFKNSFGYDAEFMKMNARATFELFIKDFGLAVDYFILQMDLEEIINRMENL